MKIDGVFAGGGIRAFAFIGALQVLEEKNYQFERLAGTSAGALFSSFIKAGYNSSEINELLSELDLKTFMDSRKTWLPLPIMKWFSLYFLLGLYKGDALEEWVYEKLAAKGLKTFGDLKGGTLKIVASDISKGRLVVLPDDLHHYGYNPKTFPIAKAIRMSTSIPYFYEPVKLLDKKKKEKSIIVDGGVLSNFPLWIFTDEKGAKNKRPIIGFRLTPNIDEIPPAVINNAITMFHSLFETMRNAHDVRYIEEEHVKNIVFIPTSDVKATDFDLSEEKKKALIQTGQERTEKFLRKWSC